MNKKLISVIIPVYNVSPYLKRCVDSLISQTYTNWEAILVDDGSCDGSSIICDDLAKQDSRIIVIHQKHKGISFTRNTGISAAKGELIAFIDSDDYIEPQMLEHLYNQISKSNADIASCGYFLVREDIVFTPAKQLTDTILKKDEALIALMHRDYCCGFLWNKLFRREMFFENNNVYCFSEDISICEDLLFITECILRGAVISYDNKPLYHYCVRRSSLTETPNLSRMSELNARKKIVELVSESGKSVSEMARCKYAETAVNLLYPALCLKEYKIVSNMKALARENAVFYYLSSQIQIWEKIRFFLKLNFPILAVKISNFRLTLKRLHLTRH